MPTSTRGSLERPTPHRVGSCRFLVIELLHIAAQVVRNFVGAELGKHYTVSPDFDLVGCFKDARFASLQGTVKEVRS